MCCEVVRTADHIFPPQKISLFKNALTMACMSFFRNFVHFSFVDLFHQIIMLFRVFSLSSSGFVCPLSYRYLCSRHSFVPVLLCAVSFMRHARTSDRTCSRSVSRSLSLVSFFFMPSLSFVFFFLLHLSIHLFIYPSCATFHLSLSRSHAVISSFFPPPQMIDFRFAPAPRSRTIVFFPRHVLCAAGAEHFCMGRSSHKSAGCCDFLLFFPHLFPEFIFSHHILTFGPNIFFLSHFGFWAFLRHFE